LFASFLLPFSRRGICCYYLAYLLRNSASIAKCGMLCLDTTSFEFHRLKQITKHPSCNPIPAPAMRSRLSAERRAEIERREGRVNPWKAADRRAEAKHERAAKRSGPQKKNNKIKPKVIAYNFIKVVLYIFCKSIVYIPGDKSWTSIRVSKFTFPFKTSKPDELKITYSVGSFIDLK